MKHKSGAVRVTICSSAPQYLTPGPLWATKYTKFNIYFPKLLNIARKITIQSVFGLLFLHFIFIRSISKLLLVPRFHLLELLLQVGHSHPALLPVLLCQSRHTAQPHCRWQAKLRRALKLALRRTFPHAARKCTWLVVPTLSK